MACLQARSSRPSPPRSACHAEGRGFESLQPLRKKACICRPFSLRQSPCSSASGRTDSGLAAGQPPAASKENARFAGRFSFVRTEVILQACRRSSVRLLGREPASSKRRLPRTAACRRGGSDSGPPGGESDFSPETTRSTSAAPRRGQPIAPRPVSSLRRAAFEAAARCPSRTAWAVTIARVTAEGVAFIGSRRLLSTGRAPPHLPQQALGVNSETAPFRALRQSRPVMWPSTPFMGKRHSVELTSGLLGVSGSALRAVARARRWALSIRSVVARSGRRRV
jgi:hypothetical protein